MAEVLLINPTRRKGRKMAKKSRTAAQRRATAKLVAMNRSRRGRAAPRRKSRKSRKARRSNPVNTLVARRRMRRAANPVGAARRGSRRVSRRRRNPVSLGGVTPKGIIAAVRDAAIGAGGAVAVDMLYARINPMLPATLQKTPGALGAGDGVKALLTIVLGKLLSRATRGMSVKAAQGALTVQAHGILTGLLPAGMLGYYSPARIVQGTQRVGPNRSSQSVLNAYVARGSGTPLLSAYVRGRSPLLSGNAREREGITSMR